MQRWKVILIRKMSPDKIHGFQDSQHTVIYGAKIANADDKSNPKTFYVNCQSSVLGCFNLTLETNERTFAIRALRIVVSHILVLLSYIRTSFEKFNRKQLTSIRLICTRISQTVTHPSVESFGTFYSNFTRRRSSFVIL